MQPLNIKLSRATQQDLPRVSTLASRIWKEHYVPIIGESQVAYMLDKMYSRQALNEQVNNKKHVFFMVLGNDETIGFISVHHETNDSWFLNKFYILGEMAGNGAGTKAFEALKTMISPKKISLTVNRQNYKSINFYFKNGFKIERVADFDIGEGYVMNDFVMVWQEKNNGN